MCLTPHRSPHQCFVFWMYNPTCSWAVVACCGYGWQPIAAALPRPQNVLTLFFPSFAPKTREAQQTFFGIGSLKFLSIAPRIMPKLDFGHLSPFNRIQMRDFFGGELHQMPLSKLGLTQKCNQQTLGHASWSVPLLWHLQVLVPLLAFLSLVLAPSIYRDLSKKFLGTSRKIRKGVRHAWINGSIGCSFSICPHFDDEVFCIGMKCWTFTALDLHLSSSFSRFLANSDT